MKEQVAEGQRENLAKAVVWLNSGEVVTLDACVHAMRVRPLVVGDALLGVQVDYVFLEEGHNGAVYEFPREAVAGLEKHPSAVARAN